MSNHQPEIPEAHSHNPDVEQIISALREKGKALRRDYPKLAEAYELFMMTNGIHRPPLIIVDDSIRDLGSTMVAFLELDMIFITSELAEEGPTPRVLGGLAHEVSHLLAEHKVGMNDIKNNPKNMAEYRQLRKNVAAYKNQESEADRLGAHMIGSTQAMLDFRQQIGRELIRKSDGMPNKTLTEKIRRWAQAYLETAAYQTTYGTGREQERNILSVDVDDRSHIDRLKAQRERNQQTQEESGKSV